MPGCSPCYFFPQAVRPQSRQSGWLPLHRISPSGALSPHCEHERWVGPLMAGAGAGAASWRAAHVRCHPAKVPSGRSSLAHVRRGVIAAGGNAAPLLHHRPSTQTPELSLIMTLSPVGGVIINLLPAPTSRPITRAIVGVILPPASLIKGAMI